MEIENIISKSIERVYQSWFIKEDIRLSYIKETRNYLHRIYALIKDDQILKSASVVELLKTIGLDYGKVYRNGRRVSYNTLEEGVYNSLEYFLVEIR